MLNLQGNFTLKVDFGGTDVAIDNENIQELTIVQDMNKLLPEFRMQLMDPNGLLTHIIPFDKGMSRVSIRLGVSPRSEDENGWDFVVFRRQPDQVMGTSTIYDIRGLMDVKKMFAPSFNRSFHGTLAEMVSKISEEMGIDGTRVSPSLNYMKKVIQPNWTNMEMLSYLKRYLMGSGGEGAFQIYIMKRNGKGTFVCRPLEDLLREQVRYKFIINDTPFQDYYPVFDYNIMDNYQVFGAFGLKSQGWEYFDYDKSEFVEQEQDATSMTSLSSYFLIDSDDSSDSDTIAENGSTNDFAGDFTGKIKATHFNRLNSLTKMWIMTWGLPNVCPGDIVNVLFPHGVKSEDLLSYQFSGYWMVERVVHSLATSHRTRLLLTRNGVDTDKESSLLKAVKKRA